jgi:hypothetical protein
MDSDELDELLAGDVEKEDSAEDLFGELDESPPPPPPKRRRSKKDKKRKGKGKGKKPKRKRARVLLESDDDDERTVRRSSAFGSVDDDLDALLASSSSDDGEEDGFDEAKDSDTRDTHEVTVRAHSIVSLLPPVMIFKTLGRAGAEVTLTGDLVYDMSCPLHAFKVRTRVVKEAVFEVEEIVKVMQGPIVKASAVAEDIAKETHTATVPDPVIVVKVADLKRAFSRTGYFEMHGGSKAVAKLLEPLARVAKNNPITVEQLERFVPPYGNSPIHWACRNVLATEDFFRMANLVGGRAARAIEPTDKNAWDMILGKPNALNVFGSTDLDDDNVLGVFKRVCFANPITGERLTRLLRTFEVESSPSRQSQMECVVQAADILHQLPRPEEQDTKGRGAAVWGEGWPPMVRNLLQRDCGLYVRSTGGSGAGGKWFACRQEMRQFYEAVSQTVSLGDVQFVRAEEDDDHEALAGTGGYIERLRGVVDDFAPNVLIVTLYTERRTYLRRYVDGEGARFATPTMCGPRTIHQGQTDVVWIDRAHQLSPTELIKLIRTFAEDALRVYVAGSTWAGSTRGEPTMFAQLFADTSLRETVSPTLAAYKVAAGRDPVTDAADVRTKTPIVVRRAAKIIVPPSVTAAFPHADHATLHELREKRCYDPHVAAVVLLDHLWTREDLAVVWQYVVAGDNAIWFVGGENWEEVLQRSARRTPGDAAAAQLIHA